MKSKISSSYGQRLSLCHLSHRVSQRGTSCQVEYVIFPKISQGSCRPVTRRAAILSQAGSYSVTGQLCGHNKTSRTMCQELPHNLNHSCCTSTRNFFLILTIPLGNRKLGLKMTFTDVKWTRMVFSLFIYWRRKVRAPQLARVSSITQNQRGMARSNFQSMGVLLCFSCDIFLLDN